MSEIAEAAGVSVPTVSKVIHRRSDVASATRERVERILIERGYRTPGSPLALRKRHSGLSGLVNIVVHQLDSSYVLEIIRGVQQALFEAHMQLVLTVPNDRDGVAPEWLINNSVDGTILVLVDQNTQILQELQRYNHPFVVVDRLGELGPDTPSVGATNWAGGRAATHYLLTLGHRRIGAICGPANLPCTVDRLAGYRTALEEGNIAFDPSLVYYGNFSATSGYELVQQLLALPELPTAIFAGNDELAAGAYHALHEHGVAVAQQMSVIGFDDTLLAPRLTPPLTTVRQPLFEMGRVATTMLLRLISGEPLDSIRVELPTTLVKRSSCTPLA
ncbi:MAG: LacI family DNA-binding transcriptional regulator [Ktedonobacteraceae bacterium]|nr:LacI family DNA-binding transcriptional regulator [Ktedonobacteraceae bacterium]